MDNPVKRITCIVDFDDKVIVVRCDRLIDTLNQKGGDEERLAAVVIRHLLNENDRLTAQVYELWRGE